MGLKVGRPPDPKLAKCMRRYGLAHHEVRLLGGVERLKRMSALARRVLKNQIAPRKAQP